MKNYPTTKPPASDTTLGAQELCQLLDSLDEAAFLVESSGQRIIAVNARATELTAYTRSELTNMVMKRVISYGESTKKRLAARNFSKKLPVVKILTRNQQKLPAYARTTPINAQWQLLTVESVDVADVRQRRYGQQAKVLDTIYKLVSILPSTNPGAALSEALEIGSMLLDAEALAIYLGNGQKPSARRVTSWGKDEIFPIEIFSSDLNYLLEPTLWTRGQRSIVTLLHQSARSAGLSYLTSAPIGEAGALIGILVAGGRQDPVPDNRLQFIKIVGAIITHIIHKSTQVANLQKAIEEKSHNLAIMDSAKNAIRDGIVIVTADMTIQEINQAAELILGYANSEVQGLEIGNIFIGTDRLVPAIHLALQGVATPNLGNIQLHRRDGSAFPADIETIPIQFDDNTSGAIILLRDKSEHEQIRIRTQQLEQRALLGEVTAIFAHEVRNPINNISTGLQLMADNLMEDDPNQDRISRLQGDCRRLTDLMESVLMFSRTGSYKFMPIKLGELIERITELWTPRMNRLNIKYHLNIPSGKFRVLGDRRALEQVFTNIISNAVQAMQDTSGGTLAIKLSLHATVNGRSFIQVDISDTGPGISEENQQRIFEPFFTTKQSGTGLGLAITKQIITTHKGSIHLTSFPGGTVFHVKLPALTDMEATQ